MVKIGSQGAVTLPGIRGEKIIPDQDELEEARGSEAENLIKVGSPRKREGDRSTEKDSVVQAGGRPGSFASGREAG
jgi:hypothetical protein